MSDQVVLPFPAGRRPRRTLERRQVVSNGVLGMLIFVIAESMIFVGFISAFMIVEAAAPPGSWPPPDQPRLPVEATALNTLVLLISGLLLFLAGRAFRRGAEQARLPLLMSMLLGALFVSFQGYEWAALLGEGLTVTTSTHGAFFYVIVGLHALHAIGALMGLVYVWRRLTMGRLAASQLATIQVLWYFVVGLWPILYWKVYL